MYLPEPARFRLVHFFLFLLTQQKSLFRESSYANKCFYMQQRNAALQTLLAFSTLYILGCQFFPGPFLPDNAAMVHTSASTTHLAKHILNMYFIYTNIYTYINIYIYIYVENVAAARPN